MTARARVKHGFKHRHGDGGSEHGHADADLSLEARAGITTVRARELTER